MKGLVQSVSAAIVIALGLNPGVHGQSWEAEDTGNYQGDIAGFVQGSPGMARTDNRLLRRRPRDDDALDVNGTVSCQ